MPLTILVTGFGPFPGAPFNPTGAIAERLARLRRPGLSGFKIVTHVFPTSYAAVDRDLPSLVGRHKPRALLMFGLAARARHLRIETRARNAIALLPDVEGVSIGRSVIAAGHPPAIRLRTPLHPLLAALRRRCAVSASRDAGRYLCNYLCWRAAELAAAPGGPKLVAFIHVPPVSRGGPRKPSQVSSPRKPLPSIDNLVAAGERALVTIAAEARR